MKFHFLLYLSKDKNKFWIIVISSILFLFFTNLALSENMPSKSPLLDKGILLYENGLKSGKNEEILNAISIFDEVISKNSNLINAFYHRGIAKFSLGHYMEAIKDFSSAISIDPEDWMSYYNRGEAWKKSGDLNKAIDDFKKSLNLNQKNQYAYNSLALIYTLSYGKEFYNPKKGLNLAKKAVSIEKAPEFLDTLAFAYAELGEFTKAVDLEKEVFELTQSPEILKIIKAFQEKKKYRQFMNENPDFKMPSVRMYIKYFPVKMEEKEYFNGELKFLIPKQFSIMTETEKKKKYPGKDESAIFFTTDDTETNFGFELTDHASSLEELFDLKKAIVKNFKKIHPESEWFRDDMVEISGRKFFLLDFRIQVTDSKVRNIMAGTSLKNRLLLVTFNTIFEKEEEWIDIGHGVIHSIKLEKGE